MRTLEFKLKIKINRTYYGFAVFFAVMGFIFFIFAYFGYNDTIYLGQIPTGGFTPDQIAFYNQLVTDMATYFYTFMILAFACIGMALFCALERILSSRKSRKFSDI